MPSSLQRLADKRLKQLNSRPDLPPYWKAGQVLLGGMFVLYLAWSAMAPSPAPEQPPAAHGSIGSSAQDPATGTDSGNDREAASPVPSSTPVATDNAEELVRISTVSGDKTVVPQAALVVARAATKARYTGDFTNVPHRSGETLPAVSVRSPKVKLGTTQLVTSTASTYMFSTKVDPDGSGPQAATYEPTQVVNVDGAWVYTSGLGR